MEPVSISILDVKYKWKYVKVLLDKNDCVPNLSALEFYSESATVDGLSTALLMILHAIQYFGSVRILRVNPQHFKLMYSIILYKREKKGTHDKYMII